MEQNGQETDSSTKDKMEFTCRGHIFPNQMSLFHMHIKNWPNILKKLTPRSLFPYVYMSVIQMGKMVTSHGCVDFK